MIGIPLGTIYAGALEWAIHRHVLHGLGKRKDSFWSFHWREHHRNVRRHDHYDPTYERSVVGWHAQGKEALGLTLGVLLHLPLLPIAPFFVATVAVAAIRYHRN